MNNKEKTDMKKFLILLLATMMLTSTALCAELNITTGPDAKVETVTFETPDSVPAGWLPLKEAAKYLPIDVSWNAKAKAVVIKSEPMRVNWPLLASEEFSTQRIALRGRDLKLVNGVAYCSPWFLANRLMGVAFVHEGEVWYCDTTLNLNGHVKAALLEMKVVAPEAYEMVTKYLTGGVKAATENITDAQAYVYPYSANPVCYISNTKMTGATLASNIAHEAWHVHQAKTGLAVEEKGANAFEKQVLNTLLREQRIYNGTIGLYE